MPSRPAFFIVNGLVGVLAVLAEAFGLFKPWPTLPAAELAMLAALAGYAAVGFLAVWTGRPETAQHICDGIPIWGLPCTGLGILLAASGLHSLDPVALSAVFRGLVLALAPNILAVLLMAWLREAAFWAGMAGQHSAEERPDA